MNRLGKEIERLISMGEDDEGTDKLVAFSVWNSVEASIEVLGLGPIWEIFGFELGDVLEEIIGNE